MKQDDTFFFGDFKPLLGLLKWGAGLCLALWLGALLLAFLSHPYQTLYAWGYNVSEAKVTLYPRPADCDFFGSPIGLKSCHYEKQVQVYDKYGRSIVKGRGNADSVTVYWSKVDDR
jgi:hypothetical protein